MGVILSTYRTSEFWHGNGGGAEDGVSERMSEKRAIVVGGDGGENRDVRIN